MAKSEQTKTLEEEVVYLRAELAAARTLHDALLGITKDKNDEIAKFLVAIRDEFMPKPGAYRKTIWFMWKPGEERTYAMTIPPSAEWAAAQHANGFHIVSFVVELPDVASHAKGTVAAIRSEHLVSVADDASVEEDPVVPAPEC